MKFSDEDLGQIQAAGQLEYSPEKICVLLNISKVDEFIRLFNDDNSEIRKKYEVGKANAHLIIDKKLFEKAKGGDLNAIMIMGKRQGARRWEEINKLKRNLFRI